MFLVMWTHVRLLKTFIFFCLIKYSATNTFKLFSLDIASESININIHTYCTVAYIKVKCDMRLSYILISTPKLLPNFAIVLLHLCLSCYIFVEITLSWPWDCWKSMNNYMYMWETSHWLVLLNVIHFSISNVLLNAMTHSLLLFKIVCTFC